MYVPSNEEINEIVDELICYQKTSDVVYVSIDPLKDRLVLDFHDYPSDNIFLIDVDTTLNWTEQNASILFHAIDSSVGMALGLIDD